MSQPIYKMYRARMTEAWYQLSSEQQKQLSRKGEEALKKVGGKSSLICNSSWASEQWVFWGVEEYPSLEALQEYTNYLSELDWFRYFDSETLLGRISTWGT